MGSIALIRGRGGLRSDNCAYGSTLRMKQNFSCVLHSGSSSGSYGAQTPKVHSSTLAGRCEESTREGPAGRRPLQSRVQAVALSSLLT